MEANKNDTNEQLLVFLRQRRADLGRPPEQLKGSAYLIKCFDSWNLALRLAGVTPEGQQQNRKNNQINESVEIKWVIK